MKFVMREIAGPNEAYLFMRRNGGVPGGALRASLVSIKAGTS